jgi:hypothetical protein
VKRPKIISAICIIGYLTIVFTFPQVFSPSIKKLGVFMPAIYGILVASNFIACVGLWYYKQWGVQLYLLSFFAKTFFFVVIHQFTFGSYFATTLSVVSIFILLRFYSKMSPNL